MTYHFFTLILMEELKFTHTLAKCSLGEQSAANEVPLPFTHASKPPINKLYNYNKKSVNYSESPIE